ncbi:SMP-30/gluconolactonase/LRE family protein [Rhodocytophaga aerolata]|uniref:SMP-30/gluconolactonase/LRE family protein n=1 Tax=Rhodocytophaga aerolata TaxID=455078 RepID=A0ABT8R814_9BACT|nr:SMP-30/gluconolactonase/LRE family protein [Rhodocytophaga aerolata]MDO1447398.1 SMP-30/gluconolactonase/LRE family protein [Rhodocytophaga aerolata]
MPFKKLVTSLRIICLVSISVTTFAQDNPPYPTLGRVVREDPQLDQLIPKDAKIEVLATGFEWTEGPLWIKDGGYLLFSDIPNNAIMKWKAGEGIREFMKPAGYTGVATYGDEPGSNGLTLDKQGRLIICEHGDRRISRMDWNGGKQTLADNYMGKRFNSPNDAVVKSNGDVYFTDPPYGLPKKQDDPQRELDFFGVFRWSTDGKLTLLTKEMTRPNGIAFSPDEKTLYVAQSDNVAIWKAFPVNADGTLGKSRIFYDASAAMNKMPGSPDGMKVDKQGNIFATGPGGIYIFTPTGKLLGRIETGVPTANCAWGDDGSVLYITADMYLCRIKTNTIGVGW